MLRVKPDSFQQATELTLLTSNINIELPHYKTSLGCTVEQYI